MVPRTHKLSPLSRKMYNVFLYVSQMELRNMPGVPPATHLFEAPLPEILRICGAENQNQNAKKYLAEMRKADVVWNSPDSDSELQQIGFNLLSESRISKRGGVTWVHWALPPFLYEALADPDRWAYIDLLILSRLNTYAAIVLYEICAKYRDNPSRLTCRKDPAWWMEILSASPAPIDPETGTRKFMEWRKYKNKYINSAIEQVNVESDLFIELLEDRKGGKAVKTIQFKVTIKRPAKPIELTDDEAKVAPGVLQYAQSLGVVGSQQINSMAKAHGEKAVVEALQALEYRQKQQKLTLVRSPSRYLRSLMVESKGVVQEVIDSPPPLFPAPVVSAAASGVVRPSSPEEKDQPEDWVTIQRELYFHQILNLAEPDLQKLLEAYAHSVRVKGHLTPSMERRINGKDWIVGAIKFGVIDYYAVAKDGEGWKTQPAVIEV